MPGGYFAFSVENLEGDGYRLLPSRRYAHSEAYLRDLLDREGFEVTSLARETIRRDRGAPLEGLVVLSRLADGAASETAA